MITFIFLLFTFARWHTNIIEKIKIDLNSIIEQDCRECFFDCSILLIIPWSYAESSREDYIEILENSKKNIEKISDPLIKNLFSKFAKSISFFFEITFERAQEIQIKLKQEKEIVFALCDFLQFANENKEILNLTKKASESFLQKAKAELKKIQNFEKDNFLDSSFNDIIKKLFLVFSLYETITEEEMNFFKKFLTTEEIEEATKVEKKEIQDFLNYHSQNIANKSIAEIKTLITNKEAQKVSMEFHEFLEKNLEKKCFIRTKIEFFFNSLEIGKMFLDYLTLLFLTTSFYEEQDIFELTKNFLPHSFQEDSEDLTKHYNSKTKPFLLFLEKEKIKEFLNYHSQNIANKSIPEIKILTQTESFKNILTKVSKFLIEISGKETILAIKMHKFFNSLEIAKMFIDYLIYSFLSNTDLFTIKNQYDFKNSLSLILQSDEEKKELNEYYLSKLNISLLTKEKYDQIKSWLDYYKEFDNTSIERIDAFIKNDKFQNFLKQIYQFIEVNSCEVDIIKKKLKRCCSSALFLEIITTIANYLMLDFIYLRATCSEEMATYAKEKLEKIKDDFLAKLLSSKEEEAKLKETVDSFGSLIFKKYEIYLKSSPLLSTLLLPTSLPSTPISIFQRFINFLEAKQQINSIEHAIMFHNLSFAQHDLQHKRKAEIQENLNKRNQTISTTLERKKANLINLDKSLFVSIIKKIKEGEANLLNKLKELRESADSYILSFIPTTILSNQSFISIIQKIKTKKINLINANEFINELKELSKLNNLSKKEKELNNQLKEISKLTNLSEVDVLKFAYFIYIIEKIKKEEMNLINELKKITESTNLTHLNASCFIYIIEKSQKEKINLLSQLKEITQLKNAPSSDFISIIEKNIEEETNLLNQFKNLKELRELSSYFTLSFVSIIEKIKKGEINLINQLKELSEIFKLFNFVFLITDYVANYLIESNKLDLLNYFLTEIIPKLTKNEKKLNQLQRHIEKLKIMKSLPFKMVLMYFYDQRICKVYGIKKEYLGLVTIISQQEPSFVAKMQEIIFENFELMQFYFQVTEKNDLRFMNYIINFIFNFKNIKPEAEDELENNYSDILKSNYEIRKENLSFFFIMNPNLEKAILAIIQHECFKEERNLYQNWEQKTDIILNKQLVESNIKSIKEFPQKSIDSLKTYTKTFIEYFFPVIGILIFLYMCFHFVINMIEFAFEILSSFLSFVF